jgi:hypothetical protein
MQTIWHDGTRTAVMPICTLLAIISINFPFSAAAAETQRSKASQLDAASSLIQQLGSGQFSVRESATSRLLKMGIEIKPALLAALDDPDAEIRERVRYVMAGVVDSDFQRRLALFAEDANDEQHYDLPGWARFRELVGTDRAARSLFIEMQRSEMSLMEGLEVSGDQATRILEGRIRAAQITFQARNAPLGGSTSLGSVAALVFVGSDPHIKLSEASALQLGSLAAYQPSFTQALASSGQSGMLKKIVGAWIARDLSPTLTYQNLYIAIRYELKECLEPAVRLLRQPGASPQMKPLALLAVARFGGKEHLPLVEPLMTATDVCGQTPVNGTVYVTQLRDFALFAAVQLAGQRPKDFGFTRISGTEPLISQGSNIGFRSSAEREDAFKKWNDWRAANAPSTAEKKPPAKS